MVRKGEGPVASEAPGPRDLERNTGFARATFALASRDSTGDSPDDTPTCLCSSSSTEARAGPFLLSVQRRSARAGSIAHGRTPPGAGESAGTAAATSTSSQQAPTTSQLREAGT